MCVGVCIYVFIYICVCVCVCVCVCMWVSVYILYFILYCKKKLLLTKPLSDEDSEARHGFRAEPSLPLTLGISELPDNTCGFFIVFTSHYENTRRKFSACVCVCVCIYIYMYIYNKMNTSRSEFDMWDFIFYSFALHIYIYILVSWISSCCFLTDGIPRTVSI